MGPFLSGFTDELTKTAVIGPSLDISALGIPSLIGYAIGKGVGKKMGEQGEDVEPASLAGHLLIPGAFGYRLGKQRGHYDATKKKDKK